jgi:hypothetical protein
MYFSATKQNNNNNNKIHFTQLSKFTGSLALSEKFCIPNFSNTHSFLSSPPTPLCRHIATLTFFKRDLLIKCAAHSKSHRVHHFTRENTGKKEEGKYTTF